MGIEIDEMQEDINQWEAEARERAEKTPKLKPTRQTVYVVVGQRGEYSDHRIWSVCCYPERQLAEGHVKLLNAHAEAFSKLDYWADDYDKQRERFKTLLDPKFDIDQTSYETKYSVEELPLCWHVDQFMGMDN